MISASYDPRGDVLYIVRGTEAQPADTSEQGDGLLYRYAKASHEPCGVTVLGFSTVWRPRVRDLSTRIAVFFGTPMLEVFGKIESIAVPDEEFEDPDFLD
jgi:Protein of unknown function (DUF2283)